jgi:FkbM family methyltransferase
MKLSVAIKRLLKRVVKRLGYDVRCIAAVPAPLLNESNRRSIEFDDVICRRMVEVGRELRFIQVGAFDGVTGDPLRKYIVDCGWKGVLVEPQAAAAENLRTLYRANDRISVRQAAIDSERRQRTLYTVYSEGAPPWAGALASFDRETICKHADSIPDLQERLREESVPCLTFADIVQDLGCEEVDLLQIDVEGADALVLSLFPFDRIKPAIIHWESKHLSKSQLEECLGRLAPMGYRFARSGSEDMLAVLDDASKRDDV